MLTKQQTDLCLLVNTMHELIPFYAQFKSFYNYQKEFLVKHWIDTCYKSGIITVQEYLLLKELDYCDIFDGLVD